MKKDLQIYDLQIFLAPGEGFEPSQTESESGVLPLHNPGRNNIYYTQIKLFVKAFYLNFSYDTVTDFTALCFRKSLAKGTQSA